MKVMNALGTLLILAVTAAGVVEAQDKVPQYGGALPCKGCHMNPKFGNQFGQWEKSAHAKAYATLGGEEAKAIGKKLGIDDPQKSDKCLKCHVTHHGVDPKLVQKSAKVTEGIQCETCHGAGSLYRSPTVMNAKKFNADPQGALKEWMALGLIIPDEKTCKKCHNEESPTYKPFVWDTFHAKIAHPNPTIKR